jgi:hypothetical protein
MTMSKNKMKEKLCFFLKPIEDDCAIKRQKFFKISQDTNQC